MTEVVADRLWAVRTERDGLVHADPGSLPLYSITKSYIAATIFAMGIDIDQPIRKWIDASWVDREDIQVRHLLNHSSGLRDYGGLDAYQQAIASPGKRGGKRGGSAWSDSEFADHTIRLPLLFEPGTGWAYSNPGYWLLRRIAELESGNPLATLINQHVIEPLELTNTRLVTGQFAADLPDYPAEWVWHGLLLGSPEDTVNFMSSRLVEPLRTISTPVPFQHPNWRAPHYQFGLMSEPGHRFGHNGGGPGYSAACYHFEQIGTTACLLLRTQAEDAAMDELLALIEAD